MARCEKCLHYNLCVDTETRHLKIILAGDNAERCKQFMSTADVVPKSKYDLAVSEREANVKGFTEELAKDKSEVERVYYNLLSVLEERAETKQEIAREIFEEIEKEIDLCLSIITKILNAKGGRANGKTVLISKYDVFIEAKKYISKLKKKYTEGE